MIKGKSFIKTIISLILVFIVIKAGPALVFGVKDYFVTKSADRAGRALAQYMIHTGQLEPEWSDEFNGYTKQQITDEFGAPLIKSKPKKPHPIIKSYIIYETTDCLVYFCFDTYNVCCAAMKTDITSKDPGIQEFFKRYFE